MTPVPPAVEGDVQPGDATVTGRASPNCMAIQVCNVGGGGVTPSSPPRTGPDAPPLGIGPSNASGFFSIPIAPPLQSGECIYAFDTCTSLTSAVRCAVLPAAALHRGRTIRTRNGPSVWRVTALNGPRTVLLCRG